MDFMKDNQDNKTYIKNNFIKLTDKIKKCKIETHPFPHIIVEDGFDSELRFEDFFDFKHLKISSHGRTEYRIDLDIDSDLSILIEDLKNVIIKKFNISPPNDGLRDDGIFISHATTLNLWEDSDELDIQDIHLDYLIRDSVDDFVQNKTNESTQIVISMHVYLPDDTLFENELGTYLYKIKNDIPDAAYKNLFIDADDPIEIPTILNKKLSDIYVSVEKQLPFKKGFVYIHPTTPNSWHSAPVVPKEYIRKSFMIRWSWTEYVKKSSFLTS